MSLPVDYIPGRPERFQVERIILAKGSLFSEERRRFVEGVCRLYPEAEVRECLEVPAGRVDLGVKDPVEKVRKGKSTLVFGEHKSAVRRSEESGNACPNYWHFSPYGFCFYDCRYCYLSGTTTYWHSPAVRVFLNLSEILRGIDRNARRRGKPTAFYLGKLQDGLALDPLLGFSAVLVPFFAEHPLARLIILTKSREVSRLLELDHRGHTILSWSVNPPELASVFEANTPSVAQRLQAMRVCAERGYPVRAVMMPLIPVPGWRKFYEDFTRVLLEQVPLQRLTLGGVCIYRNARSLMEKRLGKNNPISRAIAGRERLGDGRARYSFGLRLEMYSCIVKAARELRPDLELALCLEDPEMWSALGLKENQGRCNCVL